VRLAASLDFQIHTDTRHQMHTDAHLISKTSPERLRDEILRTLDGPKPASALRALDLLGVLSVIFPELVELKDIHQSPPHVSDVWNHTLSVVKYLHTLINVMSLDYNQDDAASLHLGLVSALIGRYRKQLADHLGTCLTPDRSSRSLLYLAALYHDSGKRLTRQVEQSGRIRFIDHEKVGAAITTSRAHVLVLSNLEIDRLTTIVRNHMRPLFLAQSEELPSRKAIYRFFRDTGPAGVDIALLSLADTLATYGPTLSQELWAHQVEVVRILLQAWWEQPQESISPVPLVNGSELIQELDLSSGPLIGKLLEEIREAQATGMVTNREEALEFARKKISAGSS
jgi:tRNA nucleotidyltransferase/poly(A) polymerase